MFKKLLVLAAISTIGTSAFAVGDDELQKSVQLKDGSIVHVFKDGKMAMEDKYGRAVRMEPGHVMEAKNGEKIKMQGDEVGRLASMLFITN
ncbi:MAG: periplasmic Cu(I)/Cu(II)-binding protein CopK [Sterolibacterium sp.]